jgi:glycogen debranching enzyme
MIDPFYIPVAAFWGSAVGSVATVLSNWVTERRKHRVRRKALAVSQRHKLYKKFIEEASKLYADALVNDKSEASKLVGIFALIGRMKVMSSDEVIDEAEKVGRVIIQTYLSPNRAFADLADMIDEMDPLRGFSDACRRELQMV